MALFLGILPQFAAVLFDTNGTFMFGEDRFGPDQDYAATYRSSGDSASHQ
jgi:5'-nucleotidase